MQVSLREAAKMLAVIGCELASEEIRKRKRSFSVAIVGQLGHHFPSYLQVGKSADGPFRNASSVDSPAIPLYRLPILELLNVAVSN
jgi:hypothetical protein